jgi:sigma-B regulation protein RsbU (phosphoserine phosphatase)
MNQISVDRLALLYRTSQTFSSSLELDTVLTRVMDEVITATRAERGFLMLYNSDGQLTFRAARGIDHQTIDMPAFQISRSVAEQVAREGTPRLTSDAQADQWFNARASVANLGLRSILCVPLKHKDTTLGVIYVDNHLHAGIFSPADLELLAAIASNAGIAIENARLYELAVEKGRIERELQVAYQVQASLIPAHTPRIDGWEFATYWSPARIVGGDYYDFIAMDAGRLGILIGDVSDKGMPAALLMASARSTLRASIARADSPVDAITQANHLICTDALNGMFITLFFAQLDTTTGMLTYVNAGHNPPLLYRAALDEFVELERTGIIIGFDPATKYQQAATTIQPGDMLVLYTDGITETVNTHDEQFGLDRFQTLLRAQQTEPIQQTIAAIKSALCEYTNNIAPADDVTAVIVKRQ